MWLPKTATCISAFLVQYLSSDGDALWNDWNLNLSFCIGRTVRDTKMSKFFARDFTQDRWRKAALKNAYSLLGKQRFDHAAAFFLLAGSLWDAIQVLKTSSHFT